VTKQVDADPNLVQFCQTDRQREAVQSLIEVGSKRGAARKMGVVYGAFCGILKRVKMNASKRGYSPNHGWHDPVPDTHYAKGISQLRDADGNVKLTWIKSQADQERLMQMAREMSMAVCSEYEPLAPMKPPKSTTTGQCVCYVLADLHIGLLADVDETNDEDWDCRIAVDRYTTRFDVLLARSPPTEHCIIANLGDLLHADDETNRTRKSGNALDCDTRHWRTVRIASRFMRHVIDRAREKHKNVHVVNCKGNHDSETADLLGLNLETAYEREKRVTIDNAPGSFHFHQFGKTMLGFHHGDKCKPADLGAVMMDRVPEETGKCRHRYWLTGHIHHETKKEYGWYTHESFRAPVAKDAYHASHGYTGGRDLIAIIYDEENGEYDRNREVVL